MTPEAKLVSMGLMLPEIPTPHGQLLPFKISETCSISPAKARAATTAP